MESLPFFSFYNVHLKGYNSSSFSYSINVNYMLFDNKFHVKFICNLILHKFLLLTYSFILYYRILDCD